MPFRSVDTDQRPRVSLLQIEPNLWQLLTPFRYVDMVTNKTYHVPAHDPTKPANVEAGNATDLASVPWVLWNLISSFGRQTLPALLHDHRCWSAQQLPATDPRTALAERRDADSQFYRSLVDEGVATFRAGVMWTAVSLAAYGTHCRRLFYLLTARLVVASALLVWGLAAVLSGQWPGLRLYTVTAGAGWLLILAALAVCVSGRERKVLLFAAVLLPVFGPVMLFQLAVSLLLLIPGIVVKFVKGGGLAKAGPVLPEVGVSLDKMRRAPPSMSQMTAAGSRAGHRASPTERKRIGSRHGADEELLPTRVVFRMAGERLTIEGVPRHSAKCALDPDTRTAPALGGGRTFAMVQRYSHLSPACLREAVELPPVLSADAQPGATALRENLEAGHRTAAGVS